MCPRDLGAPAQQVVVERLRSRHRDAAGRGPTAWLGVRADAGAGVRRRLRAAPLLGLGVDGAVVDLTRVKPYVQVRAVLCKSARRRTDVPAPPRCSSREGRGDVLIRTNSSIDSGVSAS